MTWWTPGHEFTHLTEAARIFSMSNKWILLAYAALFFGVVSGYELYSDNTYMVALAGVTLAVLGVGAWLWSVQPKKDKD